MEKISYKINPKERFYFSIRLIISIIAYLLILLAIVELSKAPANVLPAVLMFLFYGGLLALFFFIRAGLFVGHIKGNAVKITKSQFPDIYEILERHCEKLKISIPASYILQSDGMLNAFATRFIGRNYVVIYSEILEIAYEQGQEALEFIIAHELGHVKRSHMTRSLLLLPSVILPFLPKAYSRACEYTCDNIGKALSLNGAADGLLILAAGKKLYTKVNIAEYINNEQNEPGFWKWFAEKMSSHPNLPKRLKNLDMK
ncbi:MAG: M48 family metallopeptidase [Fibrobacter sp.]|jgi:Zn-dependent protease with chaperone function|nr:M48 family metallopeptidase [Fibrobacter sp.]